MVRKKAINSDVVEIAEQSDAAENTEKLEITSESEQEETEDKIDRPKALGKPRAFTAYDIIQEQLRMPIEEAAALVKSEGTITIRDAKLAMNAMRQFGVPLQCIVIIKSKDRVTLFIDSDGMRFKLHQDDRIVQSWSHEVIHYPMPTEPWAIARSKLAFRDGSEYTNEAVEYYRFEEGRWFSRSRSGNWNECNLGDRVMAIVTKSKRRVAVDAVGAGLPWYDEDYYQWRVEEPTSSTIIEGTARKIDAPRDWQEKPPTNLPEFVKWAGTEMDMDLDAILKFLEIDMPTVVQSFSKDAGAFWVSIQPKIKSHKETKATATGEEST